LKQSRVCLVASAENRQLSPRVGRAVFGHESLRQLEQRGEI